MNKNLRVRLATLADAAKLLEIYTPFVTSEDASVSDVSFEYTAPDVQEFRRRMIDISASFPYLVLEEDGVIVGYAYAHAYSGRIAYQWSVEMTIYLAPQGQGKGYIHILYGALEKILVLQGVTNVYACITKSNTHSVEAHAKMGYHVNGEWRQCGFKNGHWLDMVWMEKVVQEHRESPERIKSIKDIDAEKLTKILQKFMR